MVFVLTQQSYTVEFGWDNQKNDIVLAKIYCQPRAGR